MVGGFDPSTISAQITQANTAGIPVIGWHAAGRPWSERHAEAVHQRHHPGRRTSAKISAQWIIAHSNGTGGRRRLHRQLHPVRRRQGEDDRGRPRGLQHRQGAPGREHPDPGRRNPYAAGVLVPGVRAAASKWSYSVAINDLYFDNAATPLRAAGKNGDGAPYNVGAGDGSAAAFQRIASAQYQAATVPEPLSQEGWQIVDEFNRAFNSQPASGYVPRRARRPTPPTSAPRTSWDPANGYRDAYKKIWGK